MNNKSERARARERRAILDTQEERPESASSSHALIRKQQEEAEQNDKAIAAAVIAGGWDEAKNNPDWEENHPCKITTPATVKILTWRVVFNDTKIPGIDQLPLVLQHLCLAYADLDLRPHVIHQFPQLNKVTFFTRRAAQLQYQWGLEIAANDLLINGKVKKIYDLVGYAGKEILKIPTQGTDHFGTRIEGRTLLQIVGMAGHTLELKSLAITAQLTPDEIATQLFPVLFSKEAIKINEARKQLILDILFEFTDSILKKEASLTFYRHIEELQLAKKICQAEIEKFRTDLLAIRSNQTITAGYILDFSLYVEWVREFEKNLGRFGGKLSVISDLLWVISYGSLQYISSGCDMHIHRCLKAIIDWTKVTQAPHPFDHSALGLNYYIGYHGQPVSGFGKSGGNATYERDEIASQIETIWRIKGYWLNDVAEFARKLEAPEEEPVRQNHPCCSMM